MGDYNRTMQDALDKLSTTDFHEAAPFFFKQLGYDSPKVFDYEPLSFDEFAEALGGGDAIHPERSLSDQWKAVHLLFQYTEDELGGPASLLTETNNDEYNAFVFIGLELTGEKYSRTQLASIARELNKPFASPVIVLFKHGAAVTLASVARRQHKLQADKHVLQKVSLLKDIGLENTHAAHFKILKDLKDASGGVRNWTEFLRKWNEVLDISALNKRFYEELSNWFFAARNYVEFPDSSENATERSLIRLITRLIFTWFVKERGLVPEALFQPEHIKALLKDTKADSDTYYRAVLQNLFFATLNTEMDERRFRKQDGGKHGQKGEYGLSSYFRYESEFVSPEKWLELVKDVPFLNGGLFECLDDADNGARIDGFSDQPAWQAKVPNDLFWGDSWTEDLTEVFDDKKKKAVEVKPLLNLLHSYKFTIEENTPQEEDVALDPELLGKVFENLLASYNPETRTTARKQTGSFYTPREIVTYMVEEALFAYLEPVAGEKQVDDGVNALRVLLSSTDHRKATDLGYKAPEIAALVTAIQRCTILDPACGSGAFPMGALSKMVELLGKLDPGNQLWLDNQLRAVDAALELTGAQQSVIEEAKQGVRDAFNNNDPDYARKLFLIERCLFGVDIQPIALQISKLRFFIALVIDQRIDDSRPNRNIRALPNLETKFVAANTLIALPQSGALTPEELPALETELAKVRRLHIAPKSRAEKKRLEREDARLRGEIKALMEDAGFGDSFITPIVEWNPYDQNGVAPFFDPERMFGPELREGFDIVIGNPPYVRHEGIKPLKPLLTDYACFAGTADLYVYFFEKSIRVLKTGGVLSFICSNKYFRAGYGAKLRAYLGKNTQLQRLIDFGDAPVFTAIAYPHIIVTRKVEKSDGTATFPALSWTLGRPIDQFEAVVAVESFAMPQGDLADSGWQLERADTLNLLQKLRDAGTPLGEYVEGRFYRGVLTGLNEAFVVDRATRDALIAEHASSAKVLKPFLRGRDVKRWQANYADLYLIKIESSENKAHPWSQFSKAESAKAEKLFAGAFPAIHRHLNQFRAALIKRYDQGKFFWELRACSYWNEFEKRKIVIPAIDDEVNYAIDKGSFSNDKTSICVPLNPEFVVGILNSAILWWAIRAIAATKQGGYYEFKPMYVSQLPIPKATSVEQQAITEKVEQILSAKAADFNADVTTLEREIDELVADLYGLNADEKKLIGLL